VTIFFLRNPKLNTTSIVSKQLLTSAHQFVEPICSSVLYPCLPSLGRSCGDLIFSVLMGFLPQHLMFAPEAYAGTILSPVT